MGLSTGGRGRRTLHRWRDEACRRRRDGHRRRMLSAASVIHARGGVARGRELAAFGFSRRNLADAVTTGEIRRIRPGVFASSTAEDDVVQAAAHGGSLTCARALRNLGVWVLEEDESPHVWLGAAGRAHGHTGCSCVTHFRPGRMALGVANVEQALIHSYGCHGSEFFFAALESAWNRRLVGAGALGRIRLALPVGARWLIDFARPDADSGLESVVRLRLHLHGIAVETQVALPGVGRVDFVIAGRLILEADGRENHERASHRHRDLRRDAAASRLGYETLRLDYAMIMYDWPNALDAILAAVTRARQ
jgi:very-short-patch-repair endonuclease